MRNNIGWRNLNRVLARYNKSSNSSINKSATTSSNHKAAAVISVIVPNHQSSRNYSHTNTNYNYKNYHNYHTTTPTKNFAFHDFSFRTTNTAKFFSTSSSSSSSDQNKKDDNDDASETNNINTSEKTNLISGTTTPTTTTTTTDTDNILSRITKEEIQVNKEKPFLWDMGIRSMIPEWKKMFSDSSTLATDISAGVTIGCVAVPLSLAIALASGVPPEVGLVTAAVSGVAGGLMGGTTLAITGPAAAISLLVVGAVQEHGLQALPLITLACGGMQVVSGVTRLGVMAKLVPVSVIAGFTTGVGAMILSGQVPKALGLTAPSGMNPIETMGFIGENVAAINPAAAALAIGTSAAMFLLPKLHPKTPSALLAVGGATVATHSLGLDVTLIGAIPSGLEAFQMVNPMEIMPPPEAIPSLAATTFLIYAMTSAESLLSCAALEKMKKTSYKHNPDQELVGQGWANLASGLFVGMPVTSVIARSSLNVKLNGESRLPSLIQSAFVFSSVVFFSSSIATIPMPALSGMLITTGIGMLNPQEFKHCFAVQKLDAIPFVVTIGGMVAFGLAEGIGVGCLSAWALNYDYGKLELKEVNFPHKDDGSSSGGSSSTSTTNTTTATTSQPAVQFLPDLETLQNRVQTVETENVQLQGRIITLKSDNKKLQGVVETLRTENSNLQERLEAVEMENNELRTLFDSLTTPEMMTDDTTEADQAEASQQPQRTKSTIGWQLKGPINFASMFKIDDLIHRVEEMQTDEKVIVLDMQETTSVEFTGVEELVNRLCEVAEQNPGTIIQMWNCHGDLLNALEQCDPNQRISRFCSTHESDETPYHFPPKEEEAPREPVPYWYDSPHFRPQ